MATSFKNFELFGGAITANLPNDYVDASDFRQVPDHQDIFVSTTGSNAVFFDLVEYVSERPNHHDALRYHLQDLVESADIEKTWHSDSDTVELPNLPPDIPACALTATVVPSDAAANGAFFPSRPHTYAFTVMLLTLIRLVPQATDILVTVNIPHNPAEQEPHEQVDFEQGQMGSLVEEGRRVQDEIRRTLKIHDWELFVNLE